MSSVKCCTPKVAFMPRGDAFGGEEGKFFVWTRDG
jgi:hypothetical protein